MNALSCTIFKRGKNTVNVSDARKSGDSQTLHIFILKKTVFYESICFGFSESHRHFFREWLVCEITTSPPLLEKGDYNQPFSTKIMFKITQNNTISLEKHSSQPIYNIDSFWFQCETVSVLHLLCFHNNNN